MKKRRFYENKIFQSQHPQNLAIKQPFSAIYELLKQKILCFQYLSLGSLKHKSQKIDLKMFE